MTHKRSDGARFWDLAPEALCADSLTCSHSSAPLPTGAPGKLGGDANSMDWLEWEGLAGSCKSEEPEEAPKPVLLVSYQYLAHKANGEGRAECISAPGEAAAGSSRGF